MAPIPISSQGKKPFMGMEGLGGFTPSVGLRVGVEPGGYDGAGNRGKMRPGKPLGRGLGLLGS